MKRILSLGFLVLALGSCQSDNAPTQPEAAGEQTSVSARLLATQALPDAQRFRARMVVGSVVGEWSDASYSKGKQLNLGKVKRGTLVILDVRGYSLAGSDTVWKWFAHASDSAKGAVLTIEGVVTSIADSYVGMGKERRFPAGSRFTTDPTGWASYGVVDSSGKIPVLSGATIVRVRVGAAVSGTDDTLFGDTLRLNAPRKPIISPSDRSLAKTDSVRIVGAPEDSLEYCEGAGCTEWKPYTKALPAMAFVLRARAWRDGLVSAIDSAAFTLESDPVEPVDTTVGLPTFSPSAGAVASSDRITINPAKSGDSIRYTTNGTDWSVYKAPFVAGAFTVRAVAFRGKYVSDTAKATYTVSSTKPSSPSIKSSCTQFRDCDPGTTFEVNSTDTGVTLWYALFPSDSAKWTKYESKVSLPGTAKVFARATRGTETSALQTQLIAIVQPDTVVFAPARRDPDTVWVRMTTTSGAIWYARGAGRDSVKYADSIAVRVHDSLRAWSVRGTARSAVKTFRAVAERPKPPTIMNPRDSVIARKDSIVLEVAEAGDTLQVRSGDSWVPHAGKVAPGKGGPFTITARSRRNGLVSDSVTKTYFVDTAMLASPTISPATYARLDPGTVISISAGSGSMLQCSTATGRWDSVSSPFKFTVDKDTTIHARAKTDRKVSAIQTFAITVQQPGPVAFEESERFPDSVKLAVNVAEGDTVLYSRNSETTPSKASVPGTFTITVRANDSITAWTRRGTAYGVKSGYRMVPVAPKAPTISPAGRHVHDTTLIALSAAETGDSLSYKIGSKGTWTKYVDRLHLPAGVDTLFARASRNSLDQDTSAIFTVHSSPGKPRISGCTVNCDPGSELAFTSASGYDIHVKVGDTGYAKLESPFRKTMVASADVCAYSDSSGHRSADSCVTVDIKQPVPPEITAVKAARFVDYDSAYVTVTVSQPGDTLHAQFGRTELLSSKRVSTSGAFTVSFEIKRQDAVADSVLEIWTKRGTATSSSVTYTLSRLPPPTATLPESTYVVGKTFSFARDRPAGALNSDTIQISLDSGKTWSNLYSLSLPKTTQVWARTARTGYAGATDRSRVLKVTYTLDSTLLTRISLTTSDSVKRWFDVTQSGTVHSMEVSGDDTVLAVDFQGRIGEIDQYIYRCDNCTNNNDALLTGAIRTVKLENITTDYFTFTMKSKGDLVRTYKIAVRRTAPWNPNVTYDSITDGRDGAVYRTVKIGTRTWMAENLRFKGTGASPLGNCRNYDSTQCKEFGRYYDWAEAMSLGAGCNTASCAADVLPNHRGICPEGFHVPSQTDWESIAADLGVTLESVALAMRLRSESYWKGSPWDGQTGPFDGTGFRVFPTGLHETNGEFMYFGGTAYFWSTQESSKANEASTFMLGTFYNEQSIALGVAQMLGYGKVRGQSLRCAK